MADTGFLERDVILRYETPTWERRREERLFNVALGWGGSKSLRPHPCILPVISLMKNEGKRAKLGIFTHFFYASFYIVLEERSCLFVGVRQK